MCVLKLSFDQLLWSELLLIEQTLFSNIDAAFWSYVLVWFSLKAHTDIRMLYTIVTYSFLHLLYLVYKESICTYVAKVYL